MSDKNGGGGFLIGLLVGGIIGGLVGLLLAPKSGAETRAELLKKGGGMEVPSGRDGRRYA